METLDPEVGLQNKKNKRYEFMSVDEFEKKIYDAYWLEKENLGNEVAFLFIDNRFDGMSLKTEKNVSEYCDKENLYWYGIVKTTLLGGEYVVMGPYGVVSGESAFFSVKEFIECGKDSFYKRFDLFAQSNHEFGNGILMEIAE